MSTVTNRSTAHHCLPRSTSRCLKCGEPLDMPTFCGTCGEDVTPLHLCQPQPLEHMCSSHPAPVKCLACGQPLPAALFCTTCGADITPSHRCAAALATQVPRPDPIHKCPAYELPKCQRCGALLPAMAFCQHCGMETTPTHSCPPKQAAHACPPLITMPRRCAKCGEVLPASQCCTQCGSDITPAHQCNRA